MAFVPDCSVTVAWIFPDEANVSADLLRESIVKDSAFVPALWPVETANVLLMATRRDRSAKDDWRQIRESLQALPINIDPVSTDRVWGAVLDLALRLRLPLATLDRELAAAAQASGIEALWNARCHALDGGAST